MRLTRPSHNFLAGAILLGTMAGGLAQEEQGLLVEKLERENRQLKLELSTLKDSYQKTLEREETKTKSLSDIKKQMALFGKDFFSGGEDRLRTAVADYQVAREKMQGLEAASTQLVNSVQNYIRTAVAADPEARSDIEMRVRELEAALGYRQKPDRKIERGTPQNARIVSIDNESGVAVINAGDAANVRTGMKFHLERAGQKLGEATVATTRPDVSGLFINTLLDNNNQVRPGDTARVIIDQAQP